MALEDSSLFHETIICSNSIIKGIKYDGSKENG